VKTMRIGIIGSGVVGHAAIPRPWTCKIGRRIARHSATTWVPTYPSPPHEFEHAVCGSKSVQPRQLKGDR